MKKALFVWVENACRSHMRCEADVCSLLPVETEGWQIEDPSGRSLETFRETREKIKRQVERLIEELGFR